MPRVVCVVVLTFAVLGVVFVVILVACAMDGFSMWRKWRVLSGAVKDLEEAVLSAAREQSQKAEDEMRRDIANIGKIPCIPCDHHECPYKPRG